MDDTMDQQCWRMHAGAYIFAQARGMDPKCRKACMDLLLALGLINAKSFTRAHFLVATRRLIETLAAFELHMPCGEMDMKLHSHWLQEHVGQAGVPG